MSTEILDDEESGFTSDDFDPIVESATGGRHSDARRRIEELMERRHLETLLDDPYRDLLDDDF